MPYNKSTSTEEVKFQVTPELAPSLLKALLIPIAIPYLVLWAISVKLGLFMTVVLGVWIYFSQNSKNVTKYRKASDFSVSPKGVLFSSIFYSKNEIHRLIIRNHVNEQYVFVSNYQSYHAPVSTAKGLQLRQKLIDVSYRVDMESNGKAITLAGGLTETTAYAILRDIAKELDYGII